MTLYVVASKVNVQPLISKSDRQSIYECHLQVPDDSKCLIYGNATCGCGQLRGGGGGGGGKSAAMFLPPNGCKRFSTPVEK